MEQNENKPVKILTKKEKGANRHWKNFLDKDYLGSHNLEKGEEMLLTIARFEGEEMVQVQGGKSGEKAPKQVLYFEENVPKMILNVTNGSTIANLYGTHPEQWIGKQIQIYAASVRAFGKTQEALRVRDFVPKIAIDLDLYSSKLMEAKTLADLKRIWTSFPTSARNDKELIKRKDDLKAGMEGPSDNAK